jgi:hypothetical protein
VIPRKREKPRRKENLWRSMIQSSTNQDTGVIGAERSAEAVSSSVVKSAKMQPKRKNGSRPRRVGKHWRRKPWLIVYPDGREVLNLTTKEGREEYRWRTWVMFNRQGGRCCNCPYQISDSEQSTFEHENGRGAGKRDDRIEIDGVRINGASHEICNNRRGSTRSPIWHGE